MLSEHKFEIRSTKQIKMTEIQNLKHISLEFQTFEF